MHKNHLWLLLKCAIAAWIFWFLWHSGLLEPSLLARLFAPDLTLLYAVLAAGLVVVLASARWWVLLWVSKIHVPFKECLRASYIAYGLSQFLPGGVGGDVARIAFVVSHAPKHKTAGVTSVLADRAVGLASIMLAVVITCVWMKDALPQNETLRLLIDLSTYGAVLALGVGVAAVVLPDEIGLLRVLKRIIGTGKIYHFMHRIIHVLHHYRRAPLALLVAVLLSLLLQLMLAICLWTLAKHLGLSLELWHVLLGSSLAQIASMVPVTPGGIGVGEAAFTATLAMLGVPTTAATASVMLAFRCLSVAISLPAYAKYLRR